MSDLKYIAVLVVIYLFLKYGPTQVINRIIMLFLGKKGLAAVGSKALAAQPDRITLVPRSGPGRPDAKTTVASLEQRGFESAGSYDVPEMKGVIVNLLAKPADSALAVVYEHAKAGIWVDVASRYADGTSFTMTNTHVGGGLDDRPGHPTVRAPKQPPVILAHRLVRERPDGQLLQITAADFPRVFTQAYEESMAWRKGVGLRPDEVKRAGQERMSA